MNGQTVWVRLADELRFFASPQHRREEVGVRHDGTATLGHLVESLGVPLPEVGTLLADGEPVTLRQRPRPGARVDVFAVRRPQQVAASRLCFLLDVHFGTLARRLRLLGIDTAYRNDATDDELVDQARREHRVLLTQDRGLLRRRALWAGAYVRGLRPDDQLADVLDRFAPPLRPWTRCTSCNGELSRVSKEDVVAELKPGTRRSYDAFARCDSCGQIYWRGAHARRLDAIVATARQKTSGAPNVQP